MVRQADALCLNPYIRVCLHACMRARARFGDGVNAP
jgi:hypothetical protein